MLFAVLLVLAANYAFTRPLALDRLSALVTSGLSQSLAWSWLADLRLICEQKALVYGISYV